MAIEVILWSGADVESRGHPLRLSGSIAGRLVCLPDGKTHLVGTLPLTIGREPSCDIPLDGEDVSRQHGYILRTPQGFLLVDSSLHGSYVNGARVQAQRILADGDVLQMGSHSFRFDLRRLDTSSDDSTPRQGHVPETTAHPRTLPKDAHATGKVGLLLALSDRPSFRSRVSTWIRRYGLSELSGIGMALALSWLISAATGNTIATAYGAAIGESLGFYGSLIAREMIQEAYFAGARRAPYGLSEMIRTWRGLLLEFGPAELLDTGLLRPLAMGACTSLLGWGPGVVAGKVLADLVFYVPVVWAYERRRRGASTIA